MSTVLADLLDRIIEYSYTKSAGDPDYSEYEYNPLTKEFDIVVNFPRATNEFTLKLIYDVCFLINSSVNMSELVNPINIVDISSLCIPDEITKSIKERTYSRCEVYITDKNSVSYKIIIIYGEVKRILKTENTKTREIISTKLSIDLYRRLTVFLYDMNNYKEELSVRFNKFSVYNPQYFMTLYYFTEEEIVLLLNYRASDGLTLRQHLDALTYGYENDHICTSHNVYPVFTNVFGLRKGFDARLSNVSKKLKCVTK